MAIEKYYPDTFIEGDSNLINSVNTDNPDKSQANIRWLMSVHIHGKKTKQNKKQN